jgi:hypothetical protein
VTDLLANAFKAIDAGVRPRETAPRQVRGRVEPDPLAILKNQGLVRAAIRRLQSMAPSPPLNEWQHRAPTGGTRKEKQLSDEQDKIDVTQFMSRQELEADYPSMSKQFARPQNIAEDPLSAIPDSQLSLYGRGVKEAARKKVNEETAVRAGEIEGEYPQMAQALRGELSELNGESQDDYATMRAQLAKNERREAKSKAAYDAIKEKERADLKEEYPEMAESGVSSW